MNAASALELRPKADGCGELDNRRFVLDFLGFLESCLDAFEIAITILDPLCVPAVGLESLENIFGEGAFGVTIYEVD
jgi:hypothetical protein